MKEKEAIDLYFSKNPRNKMVVDRIIAWDESKTMRENVKIGGFSNVTNASSFAVRFGLGYRQVKKKCDIKREAIFKLVEKGLTFEEIGKLLGVSKQRVHQMHNGKVKS